LQLLSPPPTRCLTLCRKSRHLQGENLFECVLRENFCAFCSLRFIGQKSTSLRQPRSRKPIKSPKTQAASARGSGVIIYRSIVNQITTKFVAFQIEHRSCAVQNTEVAAVPQPPFLSAATGLVTRASPKRGRHCTIHSLRPTRPHKMPRAAPSNQQSRSLAAPTPSMATIRARPGLPSKTRTRRRKIIRSQSRTSSQRTIPFHCRPDTVSSCQIGIVGPRPRKWPICRKTQAEGYKQGASRGRNEPHVRLAGRKVKRLSYTEKATPTARSRLPGETRRIAIHGTASSPTVPFLFLFPLLMQESQRGNSGFAGRSACVFAGIKKALECPEDATN